MYGPTTWKEGSPNSGSSNNVSRSTKNLYIKDRKLFVNLYSSVMRNELSMMKEALLERLNEASGRDSIDDIILR